MREDDGILAEAMVAEVKTEGGQKGDPALAQFVELRKYIEHSHDGLSKRLDRLEQKVDSGFDRLGRKIDSLASARRVTQRRRKP
jgi:hypothetical protein